MNFIVQTVDEDIGRELTKYMANSELLLAEAASRLRRQKPYAQPLKKGGKRAVELESWISQATDCIACLANPQAILRPLKVQSVCAVNGVLMEGDVQIDDSNLVNEVEAGGLLTTYLLTLGYDQEAAFAWLGQDYMVHHIQTELSREMLFALGRYVHRQMQSDAEEFKIRRIPIKLEPEYGRPLLWDPEKVQKLLALYGTDNLGVSVTDTGCFQPLNSLLGLMVSS
jgi:hypothetical protein